MTSKEKLHILKSYICDLSNTQQRLNNKSNKIKSCIDNIDDSNIKDDNDIIEIANLTKEVFDWVTQEISAINTAFSKYYEYSFNKENETCDSKKNNEKNVFNGSFKQNEGETARNTDKNMNNEDDEGEEKKDYIRCVDIKKLMEKNSSSNNKNSKNSSVIVLSDSDSSPVKLSENISLFKINKIKPSKSMSKIEVKSPTKSVLKSSNSTIDLNDSTSDCNSSVKKKKNVTFRDPETSEIEDLTVDEETSKPQSSRLPRKTKPLDLHDLSSLSEESSSNSSSSSSDSSEIVQSKRKTLMKRHKKIRSDSPIPRKFNKNLELDKKMLQKCFVPLTRIHPDLLKQNYEKFLLKNEIRRLTNMHSLKRNRKERRNSSSSSSDCSTSGSNKNKKRTKTTKKDANSKLSSSETDLSNTECDDLVSKNDINDEITDKDLFEDIGDCDNEEAMAQDLLYGIGNEEEIIGDGEIGGEEEIGPMEEDGDAIGENVTLDEGVGREEEVGLEAEVGFQEEVVGMEDVDEVQLDQVIEKEKPEETPGAIEDSVIGTELTDKSKNKESSKWKNDKLLTANLSSSSDTEDDKKEKVHKKKSKNQEPQSNNKEINEEKEEENTKKQEDASVKGKENSVSDSDVVSRKNSDESDGPGSDSDVGTSKKTKKTKKKDVDPDDDDEAFDKYWEKKEKLIEKSEVDEVPQPKKTTKRMGKKLRRIIANSDSDSDYSQKKDSSDSDSSKSSAKNSDSEKKQEEEKSSKKRRRIKKVKDSSDEDGEDKSTRKQIRKVLNRDSLSETTIAAEKQEAERKARILERQKKYNQIFEPDSLEKSTVDKVVLDFEDEKETLVVHKDITKNLKPHQAKGVQFMWNTCFESVERAQKEAGSGCILAHCMGLGKTLQVITLVHTLLTNQEKTKIQKVLIVCPLSTVLNWVAEFKKWLPDEDEEINVFDIVQYKQNVERLYQIKEWDRCGGALVLGYDMFRNLTNATGKRMTKKLKQGFHKYLVDPGPDLVICDEGHLLKNEKTSLSIAMNKLKTTRRIVLTGTPLQNNLKEYWCMVQFVKPNLLGTYKEYLNRFVNPIVNGQYTDSTEHDIQLMRKRSHVLHKLLDGVVQRRDYAVLAPFLPPKHEYVLFVTLTEKQIQLYRHYMKEKARRPQEGTGRSSFLFVDFQELQRICTHPRVLLDKSIENKIAREKKEWENDESEGSLKDFIDDGSDKTDTTNSSSGSGSDSDSSKSNDSNKKKKTVVTRRRVTRATAGQMSESEDDQIQEELDPLEWWREFVTNDDLDDILISGKLALLFEILNHCENIGDKVLIFSQSLYSLNVIEYFLAKVDDATQNSASGTYCGFSGSWSLGLDYFRLDGSSSADNRATWCNTFNNPENVRARLFLISTRAGGLGINLVAANRVIIFDVSWNPSHDTQSIYRVYRFGQNKPSYIYRFVTLGTMEMKIYERQVIKQAISKRVIDEQQIDRHYNQNDIAELYKFDPKPEGERPIPLVPVDVLLGELLQQDHKIYKYHEHQSLLENKEDEVLDEAERKAAWEEFENEKKARQYSGSINHIPIPSIVRALTSILQRESPTITPQLVQELVPNMLQELQEKLAQGDSSLYNQVLNEIRLMQATAQQQRIEEYYRLQQQQQQNMLLQQYQQQLLANPVAAAQFMSQFGQLSQQALSAMAGFSRGGARMPQPGMRMPANVGRGIGQQNNQQNNQQPRNNQSSTEIIELND